MFMTRLRAAALALIGFCIATPALANGQVENAMQLWFGDLRSTYDEAVSLLEGGKVNAAKPVVAKLHEYTQKMQDAAYQIQQNATALAPELGAAWADTLRAMDQLNASAAGLKAQIGQQRPDVGPLKSALAAADSAVNTSWEFTKGFAKRYGELMGGPVENAKQLYDGAVSDAYETTIDYLEDYNTDRGKQEVDRLKELIGRLYEVTYIASSKASELSRPLADFWKPTETAVTQFQIQTGLIQASVGESDYDLSSMKSAYADVNAAIVRSYKDILDFGSKLRAICDDWG